ncbi:MAG TPA: hypothetical protein VML96_00115, partial [Egibacteraceae bacterium]|nr:hypothetical protein [Egibacteraceae bacterium]
DFSRPHHTTVHKHGWTVALNPDSGQITIRRGHRAWTSMPNGTPLDHPDPAAVAPADQPGACPHCSQPANQPPPTAAPGSKDPPGPAPPRADPGRAPPDTGPYHRDWTLPF